MSGFYFGSRRISLLGLLLPVLLSPVGATTVNVAGQASDTLLWRSASLIGWREQVHIAVRDQRHAYGGLFFDRGAMRQLTPLMDHEYDLDLLTYGFTLQDDRAWYRSPNGFRAFMGSISKSRFATHNRIRAAAPVGSRHHFRLHGLLQEDLGAQRFFLELGYEHNLGRGHRLGFNQTVASYKPDLDFGVFYAWEDEAFGLLRFDVMALDVANNIIFDVLGADSALEDTTRSYDRQPWFLAVQTSSPTIRGVRGELLAGTRTRSRALVESQRVPENRFLLDTRLNYVGGLLEIQHSYATAGVYYHRTFSQVARRAPFDSNYSSDYETRQTDHVLGLYLLAGTHGLRGEVWLGRRRYDDSQQGSDFDQASIPGALEYRERRTVAHLRLHYEPSTFGIRGGVEYVRLGRTFLSGLDVLQQHYLLFDQFAPNHRMVVQTGYKVSPYASVVLGGAFDIDGDPYYSDRGLTRYDGGFARLAVSW